MISVLHLPIYRKARKTPMQARPFPVLALAVIASCIALSVPISGSSAQAQSAPNQPVPAKPSPNAESNENGQKVSTIVVPATVQAFFITDLYAKDSGYVSQINNDIGDHVKKGQVLAVIYNPELQAQFDKAQAAVQQAKATLEVAKRQLAGMQADLVLQQVTLKRQKELFAGKAATPQTLDEAQAKADVSGANLATGKAKIVLAEADIQAAKAEADRLHALLQYDKIVAPFDGVVTRRQVNLGDLVQAATSTRTAPPLFSVEEIDVLRVFAIVPEAHAGAVTPGLAAEVKFPGTAGVTVRGAVTRIANAVDPSTRTMRVEIDLPNHDETLIPGVYAQVTLGVEPQQVDSLNP